MKRDTNPATLDTVLSLLWGDHPDDDRLRTGKTIANPSKRPYLDYFQRQFSYFTQVDNDLRMIKHVVDDIRSKAIKGTIISNLRSWRGPDKLRDERACEDVVHLVARLLAMCTVGPLANQANPRRYIDWKPTETLQDVIEDHFRPVSQLQERLRLPKTFNAWSIEKIGGICIQFTDNLADHLLLVNDDTAVLVFHHVSFLEFQTKESLLPKDLVDETIRTLALLFPQSEFMPTRRAPREKSDWFRKLCQRHLDEQLCHADDGLVQCGTLKADARQIERFLYWRDRLVVLKQSYDDSTPATLTQWWFDRRNGPQWYTFWVAILVLVITTVLGLFQCILGALQVYKAYHPS